jgi:hypothetical protein
MEISGYLALLVAIVISRFINEKGYRVLKDDEKLRLMDGFSKTRAYSMIPVLILIGGYYLLMTKSSLDRRLITVIYFSLLIAFVLLRSIMNQKKMKSLNLPAEYRKCFTISQIISLIGVAWFFFAVFGMKLA